MPYIITTKSRYNGANDLGYLATLSRRAVATLEEARNESYRLIDLPSPMHSDDQRADRLRRIAIRDMPESGGTVGPLPDGTMIDVARVHPHKLAGLAKVDGFVTVSGGYSMPLAEIIDAYNAREGEST